MPDDNNLPFGLTGDGKTAQEAMQDFLLARDEMKEFFIEEGKEFPEVEFDFSYDVASFLAYYSDKLSLAGLERITGVAQGQLSHYVTGRRQPSKKTVEKIQKALQSFGNELSHVNFA
jgi:hypothetical protein